MLILYLVLKAFCAFYFNCRGRKITSSGRRDLDQVAGRIVVAAWLNIFLRTDDAYSRIYVCLSVDGIKEKLSIVCWEYYNLFFVKCLTFILVWSFGLTVLIQVFNALSSPISTLYWAIWTKVMPVLSQQGFFPDPFSDPSIALFF